MFELIKLEWKKNGIIRYLRNAAIMTAILLVFIVAMAGELASDTSMAEYGRSAINTSVDLFVNMCYIVFTGVMLASFVVIDNQHLNEHGIRYFCALSKKFVLVTTNPDHPAFQLDQDNLHIIFQKELSLKDVLVKLKSEHGCERITIQTGGTLNGMFLREKLFDYLDIVVAPILIGGKDTSTLIDGKSLLSDSELSKLGVLKLKECTVLEDSYIRLRYQVVG